MPNIHSFQEVSSSNMFYVNEETPSETYSSQANAVHMIHPKALNVADRQLRELYGGVQPRQQAQNCAYRNPEIAAFYLNPRDSGPGLVSVANLGIESELHALAASLEIEKEISALRSENAGNIRMGFASPESNFQHLPPGPVSQVGRGETFENIDAYSRAAFPAHPDLPQIANENLSLQENSHFHQHVEEHGEYMSAASFHVPENNPPFPAPEDIPGAGRNPFSRNKQ